MIKNKYGTTLLTKADLNKLAKVGYQNMVPVVKLFVGPLTWLVTCIDDGILYGYSDLSLGCVEWGSLTSLEELPTIKTGPFCLEKDRWFKPNKDVEYLGLETLSGV